MCSFMRVLPFFTQILKENLDVIKTVLINGEVLLKSFGQSHAINEVIIRLTLGVGQKTRESVSNICRDILSLEQEEKQIF